MTMHEATQVMISATGIEYSIPFKPKNKGNKSANPTPRIISLNMDKKVDIHGFPSD